MFIYPEYPLKVRKIKETTEVWDVVRKQWVSLSPEEFVRQHLIHYLIHEKKYPPSLILVEKEIQVYQQKKRLDVAILNKKQEYLLVAECKAPTIPLNDKVIHQILTYNLSLHAQYLVITNGIKEFIFEKNNEKWQSATEIKTFTPTPS